MSRFSNLFAAGIFLLFLAVLFHYFCRVRKKPEMIVQQQIQVPEGYIYPIASNVNNAHTSPHPMVITHNFGHLHPPFLHSGGLGSGVPQHAYTVQSNQTGSNVGQFPRSHLHSNPARPNHPEDDLPPPYHVAVASSSPSPYVQ